MQIQYYLANGSEINYDSPFNDLTSDDVNQCAILYAKTRTEVLPKYIFINVRLYMKIKNQLPTYIVNIDGSDGLVQCFISDVGPLMIKILPMKSDAKLFMVGNEDDFERYDIDKVFENTVLKDCDRV